MNTYSNPMVTYDEIVKALKAILDCSKANGYLDDYSVLNAKYDSMEKSPLQEEQEQALMKAIETLEKTVDEADKVIRVELEKEIKEIAASNMFVIPTKYLDGEERRKLAAQEEFVRKIQEVSLPFSILKNPPEYVKEEPVLEPKGFDLFEEIIDDEEGTPKKEVPETKEEPKVDVQVEKEESPLEMKNEFNFDFDFPMPSMPSLEEKEEKKEEFSPLTKAEALAQETYPSNIGWKDTSNALAVSEEQYQKLQNLEKTEEPTVESVMDTSPVLEDRDLTMEEIPIEKETVPAKRPVGRPKGTTKVDAKATEKKVPRKKEETATQKVDLSRIQLIKKALDKAKEVNNEQLIKVLEQQLIKEVESLKEQK